MDVAVAAVGIVGFAFQAFQGCIQAFEFFRTAQHIGRDGDLIRTGLEFEKYRLIAWAKQVGVDSRCFSSRSNLNWHMALMLLEQLGLLLTSAEQLKHRYSLEVSEEIVEEADKLQAAETGRQGIARIIARLNPSMYTTAKEIIQANNGPIKRLRWATRDKAKLQRFVDEVSGILDKLEYLLDRAERESGKTEYDRLLREVISSTSTAEEAGQIEDFVGISPHQSSNALALKAAAHLKQVRLVIGADKRDDEQKALLSQEARTQLMPQLKKLKKALNGRRGSDLVYLGIEFATYGDHSVLVQWKSAEPAQWDRFQDQIRCLAVLLMSIEHKSFHSLSCLGYYPSPNNRALGIVYLTPRGPFEWDMRSLLELMSKGDSVSLGRRLELAKALAEMILQLHTAGWMHKNLRSENVVFLAQLGSGSEDFLDRDPYVVGYEYARPDTVNAAAAFTQLPDAELNAELYRHPKARGADRETYQKRFDMYALACVLLELVVWKPLVDIYSTYTSPDLRGRIAKASEQGLAIDIPSLWELFDKKEAVEYFKYQAGEHIVKAIETSFAMEEPGEGLEAFLKEQTTVVEMVGWCRV